MSEPDANTDHDVEALMRQFEASDLNELHIRTADFELFLSKDAAAMALGPRLRATNAWAPQEAHTTNPAAIARTAVASPASAKPGLASSGDDVPEGFALVCAPYLGTFYRAPKPGEPSFVELGQLVEEGADLCLVEVMKLFTTVCAQTKGIVRHVYAVDGQMVEEGAPLFAIEPVA